MYAYNLFSVKWKVKALAVYFIFHYTLVNNCWHYQKILVMVKAEDNKSYKGNHLSVCMEQ